MGIHKTIQAALAVLVCLHSAGAEALAQDASLQGNAEFRSVTSSAIGTQPRLAGCRGIKLQCIQVHIKNDADQPITVDGDSATGDESKGKVTAATLGQTIQKAGCGFDAADWALLGAVSVLTIGTGEYIAAERIGDPKTLAIPFDRDGTRRRIEDLRLGRRLLMPGDETYGMLCFAGADPPKVVHIPVSIGQYGAKKGALDVEVSAASKDASPPATTGSPATSK